MLPVKVCHSMSQYYQKFGHKAAVTPREVLCLLCSMSHPWQGRIFRKVYLQVYRGRLHSGEQVAVKVQRPFVLETVTVDLFLVR